MTAYHRRLFGDGPERLRCARAWTEFVNEGLVRSPNQLLDDVDRIRHIPTVIAQGRYDVVCPIRSAWGLHRVRPEADLRISPHAGHSMFDPQNTSALVDACDACRAE